MPFLTRAVYIVVGLTSVGLAGLGALLPGLPTTVFLLIALWAFSRSSERLHAWVKRMPLFREALVHVERYHAERSITRGVKMVAVSCAWAVGGPVLPGSRTRAVADRAGAGAAGHVVHHLHGAHTHGRAAAGARLELFLRLFRFFRNFRWSLRRDLGLVASAAGITGERPGPDGTSGPRISSGVRLSFRCAASFFNPSSSLSFQVMTNPPRSRVAGSVGVVVCCFLASRTTTAVSRGDFPGSRRARDDRSFPVRSRAYRAA